MTSSGRTGPTRPRSLARHTRALLHINQGAFEFRQARDEFHLMGFEIDEEGLPELLDIGGKTMLGDKSMDFLMEQSQLRQCIGCQLAIMLDELLLVAFMQQPQR